MQYARLGRSGLDVSRLCLGTMMFGGRTEKREAVVIVAHPSTPGCDDPRHPIEGHVPRFSAAAQKGRP